MGELLLRRLRQRGRLTPRADDGFTLVEVLWAMVLFAILAAAVVATLNIAQKSVKTNRDRAVAANLAASEMDVVRTQAITDIRTLPPGRTTTDRVVNGTTYSVRRDSQWISRSATTTACTSASERPYLSIKVSVVWPEMGGTKPVRSDTLLTPRVGQVDDTQGALAVQVIGRSGQPIENALVRINTGGTQVTGENGCVVFPFLNAGTYSIQAYGNGLRDYQGQATVTQAVTVAGGATLQTTVQLDHAATVAVKWLPASGYPTPTGLTSFTLSNVNLSGGSRSFAIVGATTTLTGLFPFANGYGVSAGPCVTASQGGTPYIVGSEPRGSSTATVPFAPVEVVVLDLLGQPVKNAAVTVSAPPQAGCLAQTYSLGSTDLSGVVKASLPTGSWTITVNGRALQVPTTKDLVSGGAPTVVEVRVL